MAGPDMSLLSAAIDFDVIVVAILAVTAALATVYVAWRGSSFVLDAVSGRPLGSARISRAPHWVREIEEREERRQRMNSEWVAANSSLVTEMRDRARSEATTALASGKYTAGSLMAQAYRKSLDQNR